MYFTSIAIVAAAAWETIRSDISGFALNYLSDRRLHYKISKLIKLISHLPVQDYLAGRHFRELLLNHRNHMLLYYRP